MPRFHLFEAGAFVTGTPVRGIHAVGRCVSTYLKLELLSPCDTKQLSINLDPRFHLFEAGAFVTSPAGAGSAVHWPCVSTYLKLELLSPIHLVVHKDHIEAFPPI